MDLNFQRSFSYANFPALRVRTCFVYRWCMRLLWPSSVFMLSLILHYLPQRELLNFCRSIVLETLAKCRDCVHKTDSNGRSANWHGRENVWVVCNGLVSNGGNANRRELALPILCKCLPFYIAHRVLAFLTASNLRAKRHGKER
jgi:hypothetical protein